MKSSSMSVKATPVTALGLAGGLLRRSVLRQLAQLRHGQLSLHEGEDCQVFGAGGGIHAEIRVHDGAAWGLIAGNGSIGAGEAYIHGYWSSPDLTAVVRLFVANLDVLDGLEDGLALLGRPLLKGLHWLNRNSRAGSQRNIAAHYDLGNALFERFLDPTMMYSAALFERADDSLEQAQLNKLEQICAKLELKPDDHLLEIGTGWGSMALYAAINHGCRVTTTTLSREQFAYTQARIEEEGLQDRVTLLLKDYRDLDGQFDRLVSIEMIEAVGHSFLPTYFRQCARLLKPHGLMLLQAITIRDQRYEQARRSVDFIQRYIFPGGALPSVQRMTELVGRETDMTCCTWRTSAGTTRAPCVCGTRTSALRAASWKRWAMTSSSTGCGSSISATARVAFSNAASAPRNCCWPSRRPAPQADSRLSYSPAECRYSAYVTAPLSKLDMHSEHPTLQSVKQVAERNAGDASQLDADSRQLHELAGRLGSLSGRFTVVD